MNLNKKKVGLYAFLLTAAGIGLLIDRVSGRAGPKAAVAAVESTPGMHEPDEPDVSAIAPPMAAIFDADRLKTGPGQGVSLIRSLIRPRDPFGLSPQLREHYRSESQRARQAREITEKKKKRDAERSMATFEQTHRLEGTFIQGTDKWALVDGRILRIGDRLDGFELRAVERYRAIFAQGTQSMALRLPSAGETKVGPAKSR